MRNRKIRRTRTSRRGAAAGVTAISLPVLLGFAALAIDMGVVYNARSELQRTADSAALAAAWQLLDDDMLAGSVNMTEEEAAARAAAVSIAARNPVRNTAPVVDPNDENDIGGDIVVGFRSDPLDRSEPLDTSMPDMRNTVRVTVRRDSTRNGPIDLTFANVFGIASSNVTASAAAIIKDGAVGWRVTEKTGNAGLMPFALKYHVWTDLLAGISNVGDNFTYDAETGEVISGGDGILELNLYPGSGGTQLPPGNFGTVDIGSDNNSTADLARQILFGVSEDDLAYHGGQLVLGEDGTLLLNGDTGISAGIKDELAAIKGQPRSLPLFTTVSGNGNNAMYTIVGFAGIRIVEVKLTGAMAKKSVIIQPAHVVDDAVITQPGSGSSYFVYHPPYLIE